MAGAKKSASKSASNQAKAKPAKRNVSAKPAKRNVSPKQAKAKVGAKPAKRNVSPKQAKAKVGAKQAEEKVSAKPKVSAEAIKAKVSAKATKATKEKVSAKATKPAKEKASTKVKQAKEKASTKVKQAKEKASASMKQAKEKASARVKQAREKVSAKVKPAKKRSDRKTKKLAVAPALFAPLTEGERAETLRILLEDNRLSSMAKVGRYRVIAVEPLAFKADHALAAQRIARVVIYDYSADRCVESNVDLDASEVKYLAVNKSQPMLSSDEEVIAMEIALADEALRRQLALGEAPQAAMHYWSNRPADASHSRRSAAVLFGQHGERPSLVAVVDMLDACVTEIVPAQLW